MEKGKLIVISGPSGVGKDTVTKELLKNNKNYDLSISMTSRKPRGEERDGVDYYFKTSDEFERAITNNELLEWAKYNNNYYGTPKKEIEERINKGKNVFLVIEVVGGLQVKNIMKENSILIFLLPPSFDELRNRINKRSTDSKEEIDERLEIAKNEIKVSKEYDYRITNNELSKTVKDIEKIIKKEIN